MIIAIVFLLGTWIGASLINRNYHEDETEIVIGPVIEAVPNSTISPLGRQIATGQRRSRSIQEH